MKKLIQSLNDFGKYPSQLTPLSKFFRYDEKAGKYEFCPQGKDCDLLEPGILKQNEKAKTKCSECMKEYLKDSDLDEKTQKFLFERFRPDVNKDNSWIVIYENIDEDS